MRLGTGTRVRCSRRTRTSARRLLCGDPLRDLEPDTAAVLDGLAAALLVGGLEVALDAVAALAGRPDDRVVLAQAAIGAQPRLDLIDDPVKVVDDFALVGAHRPVQQVNRDEVVDPLLSGMRTADRKPQLALLLEEDGGVAPERAGAVAVEVEVLVPGERRPDLVQAVDLRVHEPIDESRPGERSRALHATTTTRSGCSRASASGLKTGARMRLNRRPRPNCWPDSSRVNRVPVPYWLAMLDRSFERKWSMARIAQACFTSHGISGQPHCAVTSTRARRERRRPRTEVTRSTGNSRPPTAAIRSNARPFIRPNGSACQSVADQVVSKTPSSSSSVFTTRSSVVAKSPVQSRSTSSGRNSRAVGVSSFQKTRPQ